MARLVLEDGREFVGEVIGAKQNSFGEIVFNTAMTGYQEVLTDPSYAGQIITFTYPEIGNYGCNKSDYESCSSYAKGVVLKNYSPLVSNYRSEESLDEFLSRHNITAIYGIDTRALTKHIRDNGAMRSMIVAQDAGENWVEQIQQLPRMQGSDLVERVTCKQAYVAEFKEVAGFKSKQDIEARFEVVALDFGIKQNILNKLIEFGCRVKVVPASTSYEDIMANKPDGIFLSNGPGDPAAVDYAVQTVSKLLKNYTKPIFGICLGHQILALAAGAKTYKLKFGHRGANHPVRNIANSKIEIASHNHGFAVDQDSLPKNLELTHININDQTVAGIRFKDRPEIFSVQYHPEASPGPHDSDYLFQNFIGLMQNN